MVDEPTSEDPHDQIHDYLISLDPPDDKSSVKQPTTKLNFPTVLFTPNSMVVTLIVSK